MLSCCVCWELIVHGYHEVRCFLQHTNWEGTGTGHDNPTTHPLNAGLMLAHHLLRLTSIGYMTCMVLAGLLGTCSNQLNISAIRHTAATKTINTAVQVVHTHEKPRQYNEVLPIMLPELRNEKKAGGICTLGMLMVKSCTSGVIKD